jgi:hypothetical protein
MGVRAYLELGEQPTSCWSWSCVSVRARCSTVKKKYVYPGSRVLLKCFSNASCVAHCFFQLLYYEPRNVSLSLVYVLRSLYVHCWFCC